MFSRGWLENIVQAGNLLVRFFVGDRWKWQWILVLTFLNSSLSNADSSQQILVETQNSKVRFILQQTLDLLPSSILNHSKLPSRIKVRFDSSKSKFHGNLNLECTRLDVREDTIEPRAQALGYYSKFGNVIYLHPDFEQYLSGQILDKKFHCRHGSYKQTAKATFLHEFAHFLEDQGVVKISSLSTFQRFFLNVFQNKAPKGEFHASLRSPDYYEYTSPEEAFAVNFEYFFLDSFYPLRRPTLDSFFRDQFKMTPYRHSRTKFPVLMEDQRFDFDTRDLVGVDYLFSQDSNFPYSKDLEGRGHASIRFVFCKPELRNKTLAYKMKECRKDHSNDLVINPWGDVKQDGNVNVSMLKAITGKYPIGFVAVNFEEYKKERFNGGRYLVSLPLQLERRQTVALFIRSVELNWDPVGHYFLRSSNCSDFSRYILAQYVPELRRNAFIDTPKLLLKDVEENALYLPWESHIQSALRNFPNETDDDFTFGPRNIRIEATAKLMAKMVREKKFDLPDIYSLPETWVKLLNLAREKKGSIAIEELSDILEKLKGQWKSLQRGDQFLVLAAIHLSMSSVIDRHIQFRMMEVKNKLQENEELVDEVTKNLVSFLEVQRQLKKTQGGSGYGIPTSQESDRDTKSIEKLKRQKVELHQSIKKQIRTQLKTSNSPVSELMKAIEMLKLNEKI
ncbi:MAG: DUF4105 domain-containing protein [Bdellovibrionota bacterium]